MATNIGTGPQDIPLNQFLGEMAFMDNFFSQGEYEPEMTTGSGVYNSVTYHPDTGGYWHRIGDLCFVTGCVRFTAIDTSNITGSVAASISLPFPVAPRTNGDNSDNLGVARTILWAGTAGEAPTAVGTSSSSNPGIVNMYATDRTGTAITVQSNDLTGDSMIQFTVWYRVLGGY